MVWEVVSVHADALIGGLDVRRLEGGLANNKRVDDDANRPDIDLIGVALLAFEDFRSDIIWRAANSALALTVELELSGETKVTNFNFHLVIEEEVAELQVSVNHAMRVQVLYRRADLHHVALDFKFVETLSSAEEFIQALVLAQLQQDVDVLSILKEVLEPDDIVVV